MAVAASIHYRSSSLPNPLLTGNQNFNSMASVFPLPFYFESFPSLKNLVGKAVEYGHRTCKTATENVFLFVPLAVASFDTDEAHQLNDNRSTVTHFSRVRHLCLAHGASGILSTVSYITFILFPFKECDLNVFNDALFYRATFLMLNSNLRIHKACFLC